MTASKVERLLNLSAALLAAERPLTAEEIHRRVPGYPPERSSFRRAFERDKDDLRAMGVPIRLEKAVVEGRRQDAYRIRRDEYELRDPALEADELAALHLAANAVELAGSGGASASGVEALWKLGGVHGAEATSPPPPVAQLPVDSRLTGLFAALTDRHPVRFRYNGEARSVEPHRLDYLRGRWYVSGYDQHRAEARSFRVDRVEGDVEVEAGARFDPPRIPHPGVTLQPWHLGADPPVEATLAVDAAQAGWATRHLGEAALVERRPDGSAIFRLTVHNRQAFRSFVLTFLEHAEVLEPEELRADVVSWLEGIVARSDLR